MFFNKKITTEETGLLYRQISVMLASGIPISEALDTLLEETDHAKMKDIITALKEDLNKDISTGGRHLRHPEYYNEALVHVLKAEKQDEKVSVFLNSIADEYEKTAALKSKLSTTFYYPFFTFVTACIIIIALVIFVIPVFKEMFGEYGSHLPVLTRFFMNLSEIIINNAIIVLVAIALSVFFIMRIRGYLYNYASYIPFLGIIIKKMSIRKFTGYLSILLSTNTPIKESLKLAALAVDNNIYGRKLEKIGDTVTEISELKEGMKTSQLFPNMVLQMIAVGEKSQSVDYILSQIAGFYEKDIDTSLFRLIGLLDVFIIIFLGVIVGTMVIAMYLPIFQLASVAG
ncbi:MAG: type II secretion system F family protein [Desulfobacterales bacterium]|nr:type II secretion system F family protein [Desulfobacteraceae bacterium]MBT4364108.1 type II secretion system F family protein [Desulfobacteraceae bacterium]MBT7086098.1 type II secretion system F family protein [Desulfobacterales bacterium]